MFRLSKFENVSYAEGLKPGTYALAHTSAVTAETTDFFFRTPNLTASNFAALRLAETLHFQLYITCTGATELGGQGGNLPIYVFEK